MWDVLDHIAFPDPLLKHCHTLLRQGGTVFIRTPNITVHLARARLKKLLWGERNDIAYLQPRHHMHHYRASTLRRLLERNGFSGLETLHLRPIDSTSSTGRMSRQLARSVWFHTARGLAALTAGHVNVDNLFVSAKR
jgi:hypothetical protein